MFKATTASTSLSLYERVLAQVHVCARREVSPLGPGCRMEVEGSSMAAWHRIGAHRWDKLLGHQIWTLWALPSLHPSTSVNTLFAWFVALVLFRWSIDKSQFCQQPLGDLSPARGSFIPVPKGGSHECHFFIDSGPGVRRASREMKVGKMAESRTFRLF